MYRQQILDHYKNPRNYGELEDAGLRTRRGEPDVRGYDQDVRPIEDDDETIDYVSFVGDGCAISQASASMLSGELQGRSLESVREMDRDDIVDMLGVELSPMRIKCAVLAEKVAQDGIAIHEGEADLEETTTE